MREAEERRRDLERQHAETLQQLRLKQSEIQGSGQGVASATSASASLASHGSHASGAAASHTSHTTSHASHAGPSGYGGHAGHAGHVGHGGMSLPPPGAPGGPGCPLGGGPPVPGGAALPGPDRDAALETIEALQVSALHFNSEECVMGHTQPVKKGVSPIVCQSRYVYHGGPRICPACCAHLRVVRLCVPAQENPISLWRFKVTSGEVP